MRKECTVFNLFHSVHLLQNNSYLDSATLRVLFYILYFRKKGEKKGKKKIKKYNKKYQKINRFSIPIVTSLAGL